MKKILVIGPIFCDLLLDGFTRIPSAGEEEYLDQIKLSVGGGAITALALKQLGVQTELLSSVGEDVFGDYMRKELAARGVDVSAMDVQEGKNSNITIIFPIGKDRSFLTQILEKDCVSDAVLERVARWEVSSYSHIHITFSLLKHPPYREMIRRASREGATISVDIGFDDARQWSREDRELLEETDYFFPNDKEAALLTGEEDMQKAAEVLRSWVKHPVITRGPHGVVLFNERNEFCRIPAPDVPVCNTAGAGDSFTAGFLYGIGAGLPLEEAALWGTVAGSMTAESKESVSPRISREGVETYMASDTLFPGGTR